MTANPFDDLVKATGGEIPSTTEGETEQTAPAEPEPDFDAMRKSLQASGKRIVKGPAGPVVIDTSFDAIAAAHIEQGKAPLTYQRRGNTGLRW